MKLSTTSQLLSLSSLSLAFQSSLGIDLDLKSCAPNSYKFPFDLSCSRPIAPDVRLPHSVHRTPGGPQAVVNSSGSKDSDQNGTWSHKPRCLRQHDATDRYCVYTSSEFAAGRGISFFTLANNTRSILNLPAFTNPEVLHGVNEEPNPPYVSQQIPGKGMGLIATRPIKRNEHIFSTTPVFLLDEAVYETFAEKDRLPFYHLAVKQLPKSSSKLFNDLMGHFGGDPVEDIINTNCFAVDIHTGKHPDDTTTTTPFNAVLPEVSRMNHDCRPNAHYYFDPNTLVQHVHALRTIIPGEELTISYIDPTQTRAERLAALKTSWGFPCGCAACTAPTPIAAASDKRTEKILQLQSTLQDYSATSTATTGMAELLVQLYELEGLHGPVSEAYALAAIEYNSARDRWASMRYANMAVEAGLLYGGPMDTDVREMERLLRNPEGHWSWGLRGKKRAEAEEEEKRRMAGLLAEED